MTQKDTLPPIVKHTLGLGELPGFTMDSGTVAYVLNRADGKPVLVCDEEQFYCPTFEIVGSFKPDVTLDDAEQFLKAREEFMMENLLYYVKEEHPQLKDSEIERFVIYRDLPTILVTEDRNRKPIYSIAYTTLGMFISVPYTVKLKPATDREVAKYAEYLVENKYFLIKLENRTHEYMLKSFGGEDRMVYQNMDYREALRCAYKEVKKNG